MKTILNSVTTSHVVETLPHFIAFGIVVNDNRFVLSRKLFCKCSIEYFSIPPSSIELRSLIRHKILVFVFFIHWRFVLPSSVHALIHYVPEEASAHVNG